MRVGIIGGGQLGRMLALEAYPLGIRTRFLEPVGDPAVRDLGELIQAPYDDLDALSDFVRGLDVVTYEFENVPVAAARALERTTPVYPPPAALEFAQDRYTEKTGLWAAGIPTAPFAAVDSLEDLRAAGRDIGLPLVVKTRTFGYDGKGQFVATTEDDLISAWEALGSRPLIAEAFIRFDRELSVLAVRGRDGRIDWYPLTENRHVGGILRTSVAPALGLTPEVEQNARAYATRLLEHLDYVGVLAIELFQDGDRLLANEIAPRVHNSGHWTQDGAMTSQFENHIRAVTGLPLGPTGPIFERTHMVNLIGETPEPREILGVEGARLHLYGKSPRPGRKLGHVNLVGSTDAADASARAVHDLLGTEMALQS